MKDGFISVAAVNMATPKTIEESASSIIALSKEAAKKAQIIVFPELTITGADLRDLYQLRDVTNKAGKALMDILSATTATDALIFIGLPVMRDGKIYDCVAALNRGKVLSVVPRQRIPSDMKKDLRPFSCGDGNRIFVTEALAGLTIGVAIGDDIDNPLVFDGYKPSLIINPSAYMEYAGRMRDDARRLAGISRQYKSYIVNVNAGPKGASTDGIYAGGSIITSPEGDAIVNPTYKAGITYATVDVDMAMALRGRDSLYDNDFKNEPVREGFIIEEKTTPIYHKVSPHPFYPDNKTKAKEYFKEIIDIQKYALMERMSHIGCEKIVLGVSGGLDSTLAFLVAKEAIDTFGYDKKNLIAITLPGFGTTDRTYDNAVGMIKSTGADFREISIVPSVTQHFKDINQPEGVYDLTFENAQARERTQILMDVAGQEKALMLGTGDLSELALGWCTYNGDHMSMYCVNGGIPKTLIRQVVTYYAKEMADEKLSKYLEDIINTPISPELIPGGKKEITQKTEDKVGPYELSDFFLYYTLSYGYSVKKIKRLALKAFKNYTEAEIDKWLDVFCKRFISQSFKRSCMPDGPSVCGLSLSPRMGMRMPSDAANVFCDL